MHYNRENEKLLEFQLFSILLLCHTNLSKFKQNEVRLFKVLREIIMQSMFLQVFSKDSYRINQSLD